LPLSIPDYVARFGLELVVLSIALVAVLANMTLTARANLSESKDQSMIFSYLSQNPDLNSHLIAANETSTILGQNDQWIAKAQAASTQQVVLASASTTNDSATPPTTIQDNVIVKTNPADTSNLRHGTTTYEVQSGDNLISIASSFGISPDNICKENNIYPCVTIKPGQDLKILPVEGISYTLKPGDTLEAIANQYKVELDDLMEVNDVELASDIQDGDSIVIPTKVVLPTPTTVKKYVTNNSGQIAATKQSAPASLPAGNLKFMWPTTVRTITQGFSSRHSGLDISDSKMEPIYASESGFVEYAGWNSSGYGNMILINHGGGFKTRYGHASEIYVKAGEYVTKGELIAKQGRTGHVVGATGIHLHFEIIVNGHVVNPLSYVKP
jgi:murein DD-endopeptidase MepM/ murein hydrolase activator NlpD